MGAVPPPDAGVPEMTWTIGTAILLVGFAAGWVAHGLTFNNRREKRWWEAK